jgi:hypothetical protein
MGPLPAALVVVAVDANAISATNTLIANWKDANRNFSIDSLNDDLPVAVVVAAVVSEK